MNIRTFFNSVKEGFKGVIRHPLVTFASITTILLMLIIMSAFFIFSANARSIMTKLGQQPPVEVYMELTATQEQIDYVSQTLTSNEAVSNFTMSSPEENYEYFKANLGDSGSILDDFDYNMYLPYTFRIQLTDPALASTLVSAVELCPGVSRVAQESNVMNFLVEARHIVNIVTVVAFIVLFIISLFIISNMVRISVYSRSSEIEIMKFVGATNFYIRMPYIIEGALVGLISAGCSWGIVCLTYRQIYLSAMSSMDPSSFYALLPLSSIMWWILILVVLIGVVIGAVGSGVSVSKYIKV